MTDAPKRPTPTFGAPDPAPLGRNTARDIHSGRWSCCKHPGGKSDALIGPFFMPEASRNPGHTVDRTLPQTPKDYSR
jgi:hypothetical protein